MWEDMGLYWAWRGKQENSYPLTPTRKRLEYAIIYYPELTTMTICCGVFDDDKYTKRNRNQIKWHENNGAAITWPT